MELTFRGRMFRALAMEIISKHGYNTTKTTTWLQIVFRHPDQTEFQNENCETELNWFVENGYLFRYEIERTLHNTGHGRYHRKWKVKEQIYGLTKKAWAIVDKYVSREEMEAEMAR